MKNLILQQQDKDLDGVVSIELTETNYDKLRLTIESRPYNRYVPIREITYKLGLDDARQMLEMLRLYVDDNVEEEKQSNDCSIHATRLPPPGYLDIQENAKVHQFNLTSKLSKWLERGTK